MSLLSIWKATPDELGSKQVQQLVALAGEGALRDGGIASAEFREFIRAIPADMLSGYLDQCLKTSFTDSGFVLQDLVNELGSRLGCKVESGRYRGIVNAIGFDGIWRFPDGYVVIVEVKTTDAYNIKLNTLARYRFDLIKQSVITEASSTLIVVGRQDTESLEAQIRGSRHAWDMRLISVEKLLKLVEIREAADQKSTVNKIRKVLTPVELTKVDFIVDLLATTADDIQQSADTESVRLAEEEVEVDDKPAKKFTPVAFHRKVIDKVEIALGAELHKETHSLYANNDETISVRALVSRAYTRTGATGYWYAFHPHYLEDVKEYAKAYVAFGCGTSDNVLLLEVKKFSEWLGKLNQTIKEDRAYWHVHLEQKNGSMKLLLKGGASPVDLSDFLIRAA